MGEIALEEGFDSVREGNTTLRSQFISPVLCDVEGLSLIQRSEKDALTVISFWIASKRVGVKWVTPTIW